MIIKIKGGLGNQMFQYAFGRALSLSKKCPLELDTLGYSQKTTDTPRIFSLERFNIQATIAPKEKVERYYTFLHRLLRRLNRFLNPEKLYTLDARQISKARCNSYLEGWWQNEQYFSVYAETIRKELSLKNPLPPAAQAIVEMILRTPISVSLHIRRGDYVNNAIYKKYHGNIDLTFYRSAIELLRNKLNNTFSIFVFSDDIEWTKNNLPQVLGVAEAIYVSKKEIPDHEEIILMSRCSHHIIANSSFSWWGAWLNPKNDKIVIAPRRWVANPDINDTSSTPSEWIKI